MYNRLRKRIQTVIGNKRILLHDNLRPRLPYILYNIEIGTRGNKNNYFNSQTTGNNKIIEL